VHKFFFRKFICFDYLGIGVYKLLRAIGIYETGLYKNRTINRGQGILVFPAGELPALTLHLNLPRACAFNFLSYDCLWILL